MSGKVGRGRAVGAAAGGVVGVVGVGATSVKRFLKGVEGAGAWGGAASFG